MHKSAMQMQHARDIQRNGPPAPGSGMGGEIKPHQCQQCLKSFSSNHQLVQHIRVHTGTNLNIRNSVCAPTHTFYFLSKGEKPYKCTYCDRRFKQLSHVQQHTRLHTGKSKRILKHLAPIKSPLSAHPVSYFRPSLWERSKNQLINFLFKFLILITHFHSRRTQP